MIVHIKEIIAYAENKGIAVGAFNASNLESAKGICRAIATAKTPAIVQISEQTIDYAGLEAMVAIIRAVAETEARAVPIAIHLDHGHTMDVIKDCIGAGLSSVHFDASEKDYKNNIATTKRAAEYGHKHGAWVQGELGSLFGKEGLLKAKRINPNDYMTDPSRVAEYVAKTGVDTLAVSVGTMHGFFKGRERIDFKRLAEVHNASSIPLVLHGSSGVSDAELKRVSRFGVRVANFDTEMRLAFTEALVKSMAKRRDIVDPRKILAPSIDAVAKAVYKKIMLLSR